MAIKKRTVPGAGKGRKAKETNESLGWLPT